MPAMSCRDVDEICDWFWRDADPARLIISDIEHTEEQHKEWLRKYYAEIAAGRRYVSDMIDAVVKQMRWP